MRHTCWMVALLAATSLTSGRADEDATERTVRLRRESAVLSRAGKPAEAIRLADAAIAAAPADAEGYVLRAGVYSAAGDHRRALADFDHVLKLDPDRAETYDQRGSEHFMLGEIEQSIDDFDRYLGLRPDQQPQHWKRGISYYYAGRYDDGQQQFEGYQTVDDNDVENAVWRYLCMARSVGVPKAREALLPIKKDTRVPMMEVYALYGGKLQPEDVLTAARADDPSPAALNARLFYAHLYLGLYYEVAGDAARAQEHIAAAVEHKIGHYMWNVADVHARRLKQAAGQK